MRLLADTDAFCKLGLAGLLEPAIKALGSDLGQCQRLPALPHMLQRGRLAKRLGQERCEVLRSMVESCASIADPDPQHLGPLVGIDNVDPGEARLLAHLHAGGVLLVSGDKRALRAVAEHEALVRPFAGKIVVVEAALLKLCEIVGPDEVHAGLSKVAELDTMLRVCASGSQEQLVATLQSYFDHCVQEVDPLELWRP